MSTYLDEDFFRLKQFMQERFPGQGLVDEEEYDKSYEEFEYLYPMDLLLYETKFEMIFYNRPIGVVEHYWKIPGMLYIWKKGEFLQLAKEYLEDFKNRNLLMKND